MVLVRLVPRKDGTFDAKLSGRKRGNYATLGQAIVGEGLPLIKHFIDNRETVKLVLMNGKKVQQRILFMEY